MESLERARDHFENRRWSAAVADFSDADAAGEIGVDDLEAMAAAAYLVGRHDEATAAWARAYQGQLRAQRPARAVRCAFWLWFAHLNRGEMSQANGWATRAQELGGDCGADCVEFGYLQVPGAARAMFGGDAAAGQAAFSAVIEVADRFDDADLKAFGRLGRGQCLVFLGDARAGVGLLDEVMVSVTTGEVSPAIAGFAYCAVIDICKEMFDVRRAQEWTVALTRWCEAQPDLVPYRGQCLVHRSELMQLHGEWSDAIAEAELAQEWLSSPPPEPSVGAACYQRGELQRLRGESSNAESAYREASKWGQSVQPGLSLLHLDRGDVDTAAASIRVALEEAAEPSTKAKVLAAYVEIMLAVDDLDAARRGADELEALASALAAPFLTATSAHADGAARLAESDPRAALASLRSAWRLWRELDAPYEAARARLLLGRAYAMLGDSDSAAMELDAARWTFQQLGADPDLARLDAVERAGQKPDAGVPRGHGLTGREIEVLAQLATGKTNRAIASELVISDKTVARHVANIFVKLGLSSRSAATRFAYEHGLVQ